MDIIGVQERRSRTTRRYSAVFFDMFIGAAEAESHGSQIRISHRLRFRANAFHVFCSRVTCVTGTSELLQRDLIVFSAHSPHEGHTDEDKLNF